MAERFRLLARLLRNTAAAEAALGQEGNQIEHEGPARVPLHIVTHIYALIYVVLKWVILAPDAAPAVEHLRHEELVATKVVDDTDHEQKEAAN